MQRFRRTCAVLGAAAIAFTATTLQAGARSGFGSQHGDGVGSWTVG